MLGWPWNPLGSPDKTRFACPHSDSGEGANAWPEDARYAEGENVTTESRWAAEDYVPLPAVMDEIIRSKVRVIVVGGGTQAVRAAKAATKITPIAFLAGADTSMFGIVANLTDAVERTGNSTVSPSSRRSLATSTRHPCQTGPFGMRGLSDE
jgi:hypothetical protein